MTVLSSQITMLDQMLPKKIIGTVVAVRGLTLLVDDLPLPIGSLVRFEQSSFSSSKKIKASDVIRGEVIGFDGSRSIVMLFSHTGGISPGMKAISEQTAQTVLVGASMLGRVIDGLVRPIDDSKLSLDLKPVPLQPRSLSALARARITEPLPTGIRSIDAYLTIGRGQRIGIFSGAGVGKSTMLGMIARHASSEINVIALIGERGREVREFIEESLGEEGLKKSVVVVATGDESPLLRVRAAMVACSIAEYFRDAGNQVMLMMDSITRFAHALRQIGLAVGEQPATRGFTPSVFSLLPALVERAGAIEGSGSITGFYSVLVEGDDLDEPVSDAARGILDGHIVLSRKLAARGHYPAVDVLNSISRVADDVCDVNHKTARREMLKLLAAYAESEELINIGAYARGSNAECDVAIAMRDQINSFLTQVVEDKADFPTTCRNMIEQTAVAEQLGARIAESIRNTALQAQTATQQT